MYMMLMQVCYVAFWDEITLSSQEKGGKAIGDGHMIGKWRIVVVKDLPFSDQRLNGKIPKVILSCKFGLYPCLSLNFVVIISLFTFCSFPVKSI